MTMYDDDEYEYMEESPYPGPGEYKMPPTVGKFNIAGGGPSAVIMGRPKTADPRSGGPAPNAYLPQDMRGAPKYSMGTATRVGGKSEQRSPGPAAYLQKSAVGESPAYTFGGGDRSPGSGRADCSPGPVYQVRSTINEKTGWSFSKAGRSSLGNKSEEPGPNAYNPGKQDKPLGGAFPKSPRSKLVPTGHQVPGPEYNPDIKPVTPRAPTTKWGAPKKKGSGMRDNSPGPGEYVPDIGAVVTRAGRAMFGKEALGGPVSAQQIAQPGPGAYRPRTAISDQFLKGGKMGKAPRAGPASDAVSPGPVYDIDRGRDAAQPSMPKFSFGTSSRGGGAKTSNSPGPVYNIPSTVGVAPGNVFGTSERTANHGKASQSPGPIYGYKSSIGTHGISFSKAGRSKASMPADCSPGPVYSPDYNPTTKRMPAFAMGIKPNASRAQVTPGPGEYAAASSIGKKPITMSGRNEKQVKAAFQTPGPPDYPAMDAYRQTVTKAPSSVWSKGRPRPKTSGVPRRRPRPGTSGAQTHR